MRDMAEIRDKARQHQQALDMATRWLTPQQLAARWGVSVSTVKNIPREDLPFMEMGQGRLLKRRRYNPADVVAYEQRQVAA